VGLGYGMSCLDIWWKAGKLLTGSLGRRSFCGKHTSYCFYFVHTVTLSHTLHVSHLFCSQISSVLNQLIRLSFPDFCTGYNVFTEQPAFPALHGTNEEQAATNYRKIPVDVEQLKDYL
ncbi:Uncharacterized protein APZ42_010134, partial [Daphnia magna]